MIYTIKSKKTMNEIDKGLYESAARHKFGIMIVHDLQKTMKNKGIEFERECKIYEVCNPHQAKKVLDANMEISTALPCRISVYTESGSVKLSTLKPTEILMMFGNKDLMATAREVENVIFSMMNEAAK
ncbi:MAG: hypothetical protein A2161_00815 [Candidatus Schekmanbacteria bacterium RBG_13_48_7]|uniref:DUF302 domain-containing protein n=1 Tax=Candidatus Schekmanbacteria bacterium RBG_13_48_7 TaxID=1817878 RepID=A0A1F7RJS6_9BACT|nr:MAG: hypothetical protein A2161_00815 [Candidatus Schekmanbacteria bacterium RBG_13_48_7]